MAPKLPLPRGWKRRVRSSVLQILALSHYTFTALLARAANSKNRQVRLQAEIDRRDHEIALLHEELRIKDGRMERVPPHRRPHYSPLERMAIMELRAARGWSARQAAARFHVTPTTLGSWKARIDERGPNALLWIPVPVNKFPDLVRYIVRRLKLLARSRSPRCSAGLDCIWRRPPWDASSERIFAGPNRWLSPSCPGLLSRHGDRTNSGTSI